MTRVVRFLALGTLLCLTACGAVAGKDDSWQAEQTDKAEARIRDQIGDPGARFLQTHVVGDEKTGQVCGLLQRKPGADAVRFVYYIGGTAGPYIDQGNNQGLRDRFDFAWRNDCVKEGWKP